jgi:hypothetical protein
MLYPVELQTQEIFDFGFSIVDLGLFKFKIGNLKSKMDGVADGTRTRNNQNHNLELYH